MRGLPAGRQGFTLFETLIVVAIFLVVGVLLVSILVNNTGLYNSQSSLVTSGLNINDAMREIDTNIRQASSIAIGYPEIAPTYTTSNITLVLKIPSFNASGIINNTFDYVVLTQDTAKNNLLWEYVFPDILSERESQNKVLTNILESVNFIYLDKNDNVVTQTSAEKIKTEITVLPTNTGSNKSRTATIVTNLRNL